MIEQIEWVPVAERLPDDELAAAPTMASRRQWPTSGVRVADPLTIAETA